MAKAKKQTQQTFGASKAVNTVAPKANNVTASTATKNISSTPAVAPKANNVTASTATKNVSPSAPVTAKYTAPSTPAVSTPTYTAPSTPSYTPPAQSTPSYTAPSNPTPTVVSPTNGVTSMDNYSPILGDNYDVTKGEDLSSGLPSIQDVLTSLPNESPAEKTRRWLGNMGILGNANAHAARNNVIRNNASSNLQRSLEDSVRDTLLGENGLYEEVPNVGGGSVFAAILNPSAVIPLYRIEMIWTLRLPPYFSRYLIPKSTHSFLTLALLILTYTTISARVMRQAVAMAVAVAVVVPVVEAQADSQVDTISMICMTLSIVSLQSMTMAITP